MQNRLRACGFLARIPSKLPLRARQRTGLKAADAAAEAAGEGREGEVDPWYNSVNDQEGLRSLRARIALLRSIEGNSSLGLRECVTNALLR